MRMIRGMRRKQPETREGGPKMAPTPQVKVFKCRHKDCVFRNRRNFVDHACEYAAMTGRTRTRVDKPADSQLHLLRAPGEDAPAVGDIPLPVPCGSPLLSAFHLPATPPAEIAQIVSVSTASVDLRRGEQAASRQGQAENISQRL